MLKHLKRFTRKIKRVVDFLPIIWNGNDFDSYYAIELFKHQLNRTADMFDSQAAMSEGSEIRAQKIRTAIRLMDKVYDGKYEDEYMEIIDKLYGKTEFNFVPVEGEKTFKLVVSNPMAVDEKHQKEIDQVRRLMARASIDKHNRAHRVLWNYIEYHIQGWWD